MRSHFQLYFFLVISTPLILSGCALRKNAGTTYHDQVRTVHEVKHNIHDVKEEQLEYVRGITYTVDSALRHDPPNIPFAIELNRLTQSIIGMPNTEELTSWKAIIKSYLDDQDYSKGEKLLSDKTSKIVQTHKKLVVLEEELRQEIKRLSEISDANAAKAALWDDHKKTSWYKRLWRWGTGTLGLFGFIAFIVLCPTVAIPLITTVVRGLVNIIPQLASVFGVVSKQMVEHVTKSIGETRKELKAIEAHDPDRMFTAREARKLLDDALRENTNNTDKKYIEYLRKKINV